MLQISSRALTYSFCSVFLLGGGFLVFVQDGVHLWSKSDKFYNGLALRLTLELAENLFIRLVVMRRSLIVL